MLVKIHESYRYVVSICDTELLGRKLIQEPYQLDLTGNFFRGDEKTPEETEEIIEDMKLEDATFNIVGKESIALAIKLGIIKPEGILQIENVPIALSLL